jgi:hypothetical protein
MAAVYRRPAEASPPRPTKPSRKSRRAAWSDSRLNGKVSCRAGSGNPSKYHYFNEREQSRYDNVRTKPRAVTTTSLDEQRAGWAARRGKHDYYLALAKKHATDAAERADLIKWLSHGKIRGAEPRCIRPDVEHGGNLYVSSGRSKNCVSKEAKSRSKVIDRKAVQRRSAQKSRGKLSPEEWNDLARRAQLGDTIAREEIHREAKRVAMLMAERRCGRQSFVGNGELVSAGLAGSYSKKTGQFGSGVEFAISKWDPAGGRGFKTFLTKAIKWGMDDYLKNHLPKELSLHAKTKGADIDPEDDRGGRRHVDLVTADDVYDGPGPDRQSQRTKLDRWLDESGFSSADVYAYKRRNGLYGETATLTLEQIGGELGVSRELVRKRVGAVHNYIIQRKAAEQADVES